MLYAYYALGLSDIELLASGFYDKLVTIIMASAAITFSGVNYTTPYQMGIIKYI